MNRLASALLLAFVAGRIATAQEQPPGAPAPPLPAQPQREAASGTATPALQKFDLNFPGGSPRALVAAIEKSTGRPLNALVPNEDESLVLPPMKFTGVTVPALFEALSQATQRTDFVGGGRWQSSYTFRTTGKGDDAIWYFHYERPPTPPNLCRFYQLGQDLQTYTVEDITTAIQTGWKLLGVKTTPQLKFHAETKLLIAVGPQELLQTIDSVLEQLRRAPTAPGSVPKKDGTPAK